MVKAFARMSRNELLNYCRTLYAEKGISAFTYPSLKAIPKLYYNLYSRQLPQKTLLKELGLEAEYKGFLLNQPYKYGSIQRERWSWDTLLKKALTIKEAQGRLPPALWFQKNGHGALIQALYNLGHTWAELREGVGDFTDSNFVQSRNGIRWLSHAEASLSNFLYARGIEHKKGERYDDAFAEIAPTRYAIYDLHFLGKQGQWVDVEIWGDRPNGHNEEKYATTRAAKEAFNADNPNFIGIHHSDCYDEDKLSDILSPYIGRIAPFRFDKPTDPLIHSTHWSNADELLVFCKDLASKRPNGEFPPEDWLRKRGKFADRDGPAYNTLSVYIKQWLGGIRNLRKLIGQEEASTQHWDKDSALVAYKAFYDRHGMTPQQARHAYKQGDSRVTYDDSLKASNIASAVQRYAGGANTANEALGIQVERQVKWSNEALLGAIKQIMDEYGLSPNQVLYDHKRGKIELPAEHLKWIGQVKDAVTRFPNGLDGIYAELGTQAPKRKRS
jgi:hypothetical protein